MQNSIHIGDDSSLSLQQKLLVESPYNKSLKSGYKLSLGSHDPTSLEVISQINFTELEALFSRRAPISDYHGLQLEQRIVSASLGNQNVNTVLSEKNEVVMVVDPDVSQPTSNRCTSLSGFGIISLALVLVFIAAKNFNFFKTFPNNKSKK